MDTVYGTKKYFQSLGAADNDYYNRHSSSTARAMVCFLLFNLKFNFFFVFAWHNLSLVFLSVVIWLLRWPIFRLGNKKLTFFCWLISWFLFPFYYVYGFFDLLFNHKFVSFNESTFISKILYFCFSIEENSWRKSKDEKNAVDVLFDSK